MISIDSDKTWVCGTNAIKRQNHIRELSFFCGRAAVCLWGAQIFLAGLREGAKIFIGSNRGGQNFFLGPRRGPRISVLLSGRFIIQKYSIREF